MTLISIVYGNGFPVIVSDRAISDRQFSGKVVLPTTGVETSDDTSVVTFRVKSIIIQNILCVAFAGLVSEIESLQDYIIDYFLYRDVNEKNFDEFLQQLQHSNEVSLLFALGGPEFIDNKVKVAYTGSWQEDHSKVNLDILACGSGASEWIQHYLKYQNYLSSSGDKLVDCKHRVLFACAKFISDEIQTTDLLNVGWGGGFDIIYYEKGQFFRYDDVVYTFLYASEGASGSIVVYSINHNRYENGRAIALNIDYNGATNSVVVPPFGLKGEINLDNFPPFLKSSDIVTCIFLKKQDGSPDCLIVLAHEWDKAAMPMFFAYTLEGNFQCAFKPEYWEMIRESLRLYLD